MTLTAKQDALATGRLRADWTPAVDICELSDRFVLTADLPGVAPESIDIRMQDDLLTLSGERASEHNGQPRHRHERASGRFLRRFRLPVAVDTDGIAARSRHGALEITVPKAARTRPRRIDVDAA